MLKGKLNIAMIGQKRIAYREGGVEVAVEELSTRMVKLGHKVTCFNRKNWNSFMKRSKKMKFYKGVRCKDVLTIDIKGIAAATSSFFGAIEAAVGRFDVVHFHAEGPAFMCWLPKLFGKKIVVTIHGLDYQREKWGRFASWYILCGEKIAVKLADEIVVLTESLQEYFMNTYGRKTILIPNGITSFTKHGKDQICKEFDLKEKGYILFVGRLVPEKGIHYLIKAYKRLRTDKKLVIAGSCSDTREYVAALKRLAGKNPNIIFTDFVKSEFLEELYANSYLYCLPSNLEGMPLTLLEAMTCGCCCVVSDIMENVGVVGEHGIIFRQGDVGHFTEILQDLCDHPEKVEAYRKSVLEYIKTRPDWDSVTERTLEIYQNILSTDQIGEMDHN